MDNSGTPCRINWCQSQCPLPKRVDHGLIRSPKHQLGKGVRQVIGHLRCQVDRGILRQRKRELARWSTRYSALLINVLCRLERSLGLELYIRGHEVEWRTQSFCTVYVCKRRRVRNYGISNEGILNLSQMLLAPRAESVVRSRLDTCLPTPLQQASNRAPPISQVAIHRGIGCGRQTQIPIHTRHELYRVTTNVEKLNIMAFHKALMHRMCRNSHSMPASLQFGRNQNQRQHIFP